MCSTIQAGAVRKLPPSPARGTGSIRGHVRLEEGGPLEGVLVRAEIIPPRTPARVAGAPTEDDLEGEVAEFARRRRLARASRVECRKDAAGSLQPTAR